MKHRARKGLAAGLVALAGLACGTERPTGLTDVAAESQGDCIGGPGEVLATFDDPALEEAVRAAMGVGPDAPFTCALIARVRALDAAHVGIRSLGGIEVLTSLTALELWSNSISDVTPLAALTQLESLSLRSNEVGDIEGLGELRQLESLDLGSNSVSDISALGGLTSLGWLGLEGNAITDIGALQGLTGLMFLVLRGNAELTSIRALLDNVGLGSGDTVWLQSTGVSCDDVAALEAKGVTVQSDCP